MTLKDRETPIRWKTRDQAEEGVEYWSTPSVAEMTGVHRLTIMRWERQKKISQAAWSRRANGRRWTRAQVEEIKDYARAQRPGRSVILP